LKKESTHPISDAVLRYVEDKGLDLHEVSKFETIQGKGIKAVVDNKTIYIGSIKLIDDLNIDNPLEEQFTTLLNQAKTVNFVIVDNVVEAIYAVRDEIKDTSKLVIGEMKQRGLVPYMITGDNKIVANQIAKELGIDNVHSEVLPHEKADIITSIQQNGNVVAFVGDGINDAPALKLADIGIAMGHGTDIAIDSSDVTLMSYDLGLVIKAIDMSKATLRNIYQNFGWAFSYNLIAIPLAATGRLSMVVAAAAMAFSSITVVLNALRLKTYKLPEFKVEGEKNMKLTVTNMTCGHCKMTIEKALHQNGFSNVEIDLDSKTVEVDLQGKTEQEVREIITAKGYEIK
jgi:Cu+-exporting ATPase